MSDALKLAERLRNLAAPQPAAPQAVNPLDALLTQIINRRVVVEQQLFDMAAGKLPMPDKDKLRELAVYLGTPSSQPTAPAPETDGEKWCLNCDKAGHVTNECYSTHGLNTPRDREISRLCNAVNAQTLNDPSIISQDHSAKDMRRDRAHDIKQPGSEAC